jgi:chemotaxis regulatin CheY-phosphate phosphatase CheZ
MSSTNINQFSINRFNATQEKLATYWKILEADWQDFLEAPTATRLENLTSNCRAYLNQVSNGQLVLPRVFRKPS